jgi:hypothetical protein
LVNQYLTNNQPKEVLGIVAGQELPRRGRCQHYAKSQRWFRFSCCAKVFPCDKYVHSTFTFFRFVINKNTNENPDAMTPKQTIQTNMQTV